MALRLVSRRAVQRALACARIPTHMRMAHSSTSTSGTASPPSSSLFLRASLGASVAALTLWATADGESITPLHAASATTTGSPAPTPTPGVYSVSAKTIETKAEQMYGSNPRAIYDMIVSHLSLGGEASAAILWRLARAAHDLAAELTDVTAKKSLTYEGLEAAKKALALDDRSFACHKWMAIMLSDLGEYEGTKKKLLNAYVMKDHFSQAIALNPSDPTSRHLLGLWCFAFADLAWYERKAASALFATPPSSSYEEALSHFLEAEKIQPRFYAKNSMMLGKTYLRLNNKQEAKKYLLECLSLPSTNADDRAAHAEAKTLLAQC